MIHHTRRARTDHRVWDGTYDENLDAWLGDGTHHWADDALIIKTPEGDITMLPGWTVIRWDDGELTVTSPRVIARLWQPEGRCAAMMMSHSHPPHEWEPQPGTPTVYCPGNQDTRQ